MSLESVWQKYLKNKSLKITLVKVKFDDKTVRGLLEKYFGKRKVNRRY